MNFQKADTLYVENKKPVCAVFLKREKMRAFITSRPRSEAERSVNAQPAPDYQNWYDGYLKKLRGGSNPEYECILCGKVFFGSTRAATHLYCCDGSGIEKCANITDEKKEIVKARYEKQCPTKKRKAEEAPDANQPSASDAKAKRHLPKGWKATADKMFARLIFLAMLPFSFASNLWLRSFINDGLRVIYSPPGRKLIQGRLLDEEDREVQTKVDALLQQSDYLQIASDGWSNLRGEAIISYVVTCTLGDFFVHSSDASIVEKKSAEWCFADFEKRMSKCGGVVKINGFISDTENKMRATWKLIENKYPSIHAYGCCTHTLQLLMKDICSMEWAAALLKSANSIVLWFRNHHFPAAKLKEYSRKLLGKAIRPVKNSKTRFAAWAYVCERLLKLKSSLRAVVDDDSYKSGVQGKKGREEEPDDKEPSSIINDGSFWDGLVVLLKILMPIRIFLRYTDRRDSSICYVYEKWSELQSKVETEELSGHFTETVRSEIVELVGKRWDSVHEDVHAAGFCFDPTNRTCNIEGENEELWSGFLRVLKRHLSRDELTKALLEWALYQSPGGVRTEVQTLIGKVSPRQFWFSFCGRYPTLRKVALRICPLRAGTRCVESHFSVMGNVHSAARNRMINSVVRKLTRVNQNTKMLETAEAIQKCSKEGDYEKERAALEKKIEEEEAAKIAAFDESDSDYASDTDSENEARGESSDDEAQ